MPVNFLADADLNQKIVAGLRRRASSIDIWSAHEGNVIGLADPEVLQVAADSGRILLSQDQNTMPRHFTEFLRDRSSPGLRFFADRHGVWCRRSHLLRAWLETRRPSGHDVNGYLLAVRE